MSSEIRDTIMISVSLILMASLLSFVSYLMGVRGDIAEMRSNEVYTKEVIHQTREYNKYETDTLYGGDVIAAIRDYYDSGITIAVKEGSNVVYKINKEIAERNPNMFTTQYLTGEFNVTDEYEPVLVYHQKPVESVDITYSKPSNARGVTAIVFFKK